MVRPFPSTQPEEMLLVRGARQLITMRGADGPKQGPALEEIGIISDGALLIRAGRIVEAGPTRRVENVKAARHAKEINAAGHVITPAFVDCRAHIVLPHPPLDPSAAGPDHVPAEFWRGVREIRSTPARRLELRAQNVAASMARHGTTTAGALSGYGLDRSGELKILRVLARIGAQPLRTIPIFFGARLAPLERQMDSAGYLEWVRLTLLPGIARRKLARFVEVNCGADGFPLDAARIYLENARRLGFRLNIDAGDRLEAVRLAAEIGASRVALGAVDAETCDMLARSGTVAALEPASAGDRQSARRLIDAGAAVAIASDFGSAKNRTYNMQMVMSLACSELEMSPAEALCAATINGAHALGLGQELGSLLPGKRADLVMFNVQDYREISYHFGINHVHMVMKDGAAIYQEGGRGL